MPFNTFRGGVHPPEFKELACSRPVETLPAPERVVLPMVQHMGAPCEPTVGRGDAVAMGQVIGDSDAFVSAPIHTSVSGSVEALGQCALPDGRKVAAVIIESDGEDRLHEDIAPAGALADLSPDDIRRLVRKAGIVGMGGAAFPAHVKYSPPPDVSVDTIILNGCECEPFLTCDHRAMLEEPEAIIFGLEAIMKACEAERGVIGVEDNTPDASEALRRAIGNRPYEVVSLQTKYPEGAEKQLITAITDREVPSGGLPLHIGVVVSNVSTAVAVARAIRSGIPFIERVVTVSGDAVAQPKNLRVRLGTPIEVLLEACGGFSEPPVRLISGGPMMGSAIHDLDMPVTKGTSGVIALSDRVSPVLEE